MAAKKGNSGFADRRNLTPMERFLSFCRFEPETGCVIWVGGQTKGRGHSVPYPTFWFEGRRWFGHRWAAKYIHGLDIDSFHVDHCCPHIPIPNTLCVAHLQAITPKLNRELQHTRRRAFIHIQVGLMQYSDVYGVDPLPDPISDTLIPFHEPPAWFTTKGNTDVDACPF